MFPCWSYIGYVEQKKSWHVICDPGRRSVGGQRDTSLILFEVAGTPFIVLPYFFGYTFHFCNAQDIYIAARSTE